MDITLEEIKEQIQNKISKLEKLKVQEEELKKLQEAVAEIPKLRADISALERTLAILQGKDDFKPQDQFLSLNTIPNLAAMILRERGQPMDKKELQQELATRGKQTNLNTIMSVLHREVAKGRVFKMVSPGRFGLVEWPETRYIL